MEKIHSNFDPMTGMKEDYYLDEGGKLVIDRKGDIAPILEWNKERYNNEDFKKQGIKKGLQHVAHIPDAVILKWRTEGIDVFNPAHRDAIFRKLRDPEYKYLRTSAGQI